MKKEQSELLFELALKNMGVSFTKDSRRLEFVVKKGIFKTLYRIGIWYFGDSEGKEPDEYYMYGMPETNSKIIDLIKVYYDKDVIIEFESDEPKKYDWFPCL